MVDFDPKTPDKIIPNRRQARCDIFTIVLLIVGFLGLFVGTILSEMNLWTTTVVITCAVILTWIVARL